MTDKTETISTRQKNYTLFVLVLVFTSSHVDRQIMGILGQPIKESLQISDTQLGLLTGIMFAVFYATVGMPMACGQTVETGAISYLFQFFYGVV
jgi:hypothetical protein